MKRCKLLLAVFLALATSVVAQGPQRQAPPITTSQVILPVYSANLTPATQANTSLVGNPGPQTIYYWMVSNFLLGASSPVGPFTVRNAANTLSGTQYVAFTPVYPAGITSIDLLKTTTPIPPNGACNCAVATGSTSGTINDQSNSTGAYTVAPVDVTAFNLTLDNEVQGAASTHLILRQNGVQIADLSTGGLPSTPTASQCLLSVGGGSNQGVWGSCSGSSSSNWSSIVPGTGSITAGTYNVPTGATIAATGSGTINATQLGGATFAAPGAIGSGTPSTGAFTTLSASSTVSGTGFSTYLASPPAIGGTTPAASSFTTIGATGQITSTVTTGTAPFVVASTTNVPNLNAGSLNGKTFPNPGPIGGTTAAAGFFTTGSFTGNLTTNVTGGGTQCLHVDNTGLVTGTTSDCGSGGSTAFSAITAGTNTNALVMGSLGSLGTSGSGTITATSAAKWTSARNLAGNSVDGSANVAFANKFIVQGTTDTGLSGAQFLGALGTGLLKNTTSTGVLSIGASADVIALFSGTCNSSTYLRGDGSCNTPSGAGTITGSGTAGLIPVFSGTTAIGNSSIADNGSAISSSEPATFGTLTASGAGAGTFQWPQGTALPACPTGTPNCIQANTFFLQAPTGISTTFGWTVPSATNASAGLLHLAASGGSPVTSVASVSGVAIADFTATGTPSSSTFLRGDNTWATPAGGGGPGTGTQYDPSYWATTSTLGSIAPASGYDSVPQYMSGTTTSGAFTAAPAFGPAGIPVDSSNPATLLATDRGSLLLWTSGTALALPAQVGGAFANNDAFALKNLAGATLTITPNAGAGDTINGSASDAALANFYVKVTSNGSGAWYDAQTPTKQAFGSTCLNFLAWSTTTGFSCSGTMGASGTAGTLAMFPSSGNFTTTLGSAATASNTVLFPATVPTTLYGVHCVTASTTCTLTTNGYPFNAIPTADLAATGTFVFNNAANTFSTGLQTFTNATISLPSSAAYAPTTAALFGYDSTNNRLVFGNGTTTAIPTFITATPTTNVLSKFSGAIGLEANSSITDNATLISTTEGISVAPTSTSQVGAIINNPTSTSVDIADFQVNGTNEAKIGNAGLLTLGAATGCTYGTAGGFCSNEGTDITPASTVLAMNGNSGDHGGHWSENGATIQHLPQAFVLAGSAYTNATTTFSNVAGGSGPTLAFPVNASVSYTATCYIMWQGSATTTGPKFQWTGPASPTAVAASMHSPVTTTTYIDATATAFSSSMADTGTITTATNFMAVVTIGLNNGTTAGTVTLQAAANGTGTLTIQPGSYCIAQ